MINTFDTDKNFWIEHPDMKVISPFKQIFEDDKSKKKEDSSKMMWFIVLCYDRDSKFYKLSAEGLDGKHSIVGEDFMGDIKYYSKWKLVLEPVIEEYIRLQYSPMERHLKTWEDLLDKRTSFLKSQEYDFETDEKLDKMAERTLKVHNTIKQIKEDLGKEAQEGTVKGGGQKSLAD